MTVDQVLEVSARMERPTRDTLLELVAESGVSGDQARAYLAGWMRYYLGKGTPISAHPSIVRQGLERWISRRAWDILERNRHRLPPLRDDLEPCH